MPAGEISAARSPGVFRYGRERGLITHNPVEDLARYTVQSRERVLSLGELKSVWLASGDDDFGTIVKLLILTGQRRTEIGGLRRDELQDGAIVLPGARTKNRTASITCRCPRWRVKFWTNNSHGSRPIVNTSSADEAACRSEIGARRRPRLTALSRQSAASRWREWVLHDLRRSVATAS